MFTPSKMFLLLFETMVTLAFDFPLKFCFKLCIFSSLLILVPYLDSSLCSQIFSYFYTLRSHMHAVNPSLEIQTYTGNCLFVSHLLHTYHLQNLTPQILCKPATAHAFPSTVKGKVLWQSSLASCLNNS